MPGSDLLPVTIFGYLFTNGDFYYSEYGGIVIVKELPIYFKLFIWFPILLFCFLIIESFYFIRIKNNSNLVFRKLYLYVGVFYLIVLTVLRYSVKVPYDGTLLIYGDWFNNPIVSFSEYIGLSFICAVLFIFFYLTFIFIFRIFDFYNDRKLDDDLTVSIILWLNKLSERIRL